MGSVIMGQQAQEQFGMELSLGQDGLTLAVGVSWYEAKSQDSWTGAVRVYRYQGGDWQQLGGQLAEGENLSKFGYSVDLSSDGNRLVVGSSGYSPDLCTGLVRVYDYVNQQWDQHGGDIQADSPYDHFGYSVSLSGDGTVLAAGANAGTVLIDGALHCNTGKVQVFREATDSWLPMGYVVEGSVDDHLFGSEVNLSADGAVLACCSTPGNDV